MAAAASGRNSGSVQHPFDPVLRDLHLETLRHYRELADFELPSEPAGVLMLARERAVLEPSVREVARDCPELAPALLGPDELRTVEPTVRPGLWGCRLETGYPVRPAAATRAFAKRAYAAGARFHEGETAWPWVIGARARGVLAAGVRRPAGAVLVAAGPWTPEVIDPTRAWQPIVPVWGVVAEIEMDDPPRHVLEETGVEAVGAGGVASIFSLVAADGQVSVGSTFLAEQPDAPAWAPNLRRAGRALRARPAPGQGRWRAGLRAPAVGGRPPPRGGVPGPRGALGGRGARALGYLHRPGHGADSGGRACSARAWCRRRFLSREPVP